MPYLENQSLALLTSLRLTPGILSAARLMRCRPTQREMPYKVQAPSTEPMVAQMIAPGRLRVPRAAVKPESGRMTSDGMGGKMDSRAMAKGHADTADGFHQHDQPVGDGADQAGFGGGADGCGVGCKNSGGCHGKTHRGHCPKVFPESEA